MKNVLLSLFLLFLYLGVSGQTVEFAIGSWEEINQRAAKENKYILVDAYTDWCYWCKVMDKNTFTDTAVANFLNSKFIPVKRDFEDGKEGTTLAMKFRTMGFPSILIFNPGGQLVMQFSGYRPNNQDFIREVDKALQIKDEKVFAFDSRVLDLPWPNFYRDAFGANGKRKFPKDEEVAAFLNQQTDLFGEIAWSVIYRFKMMAKYENQFLNNYTKYMKMYGANEVESKLTATVFDRIMAAVETKDYAVTGTAINLLYEKMDYKPKGEVDLTAINLTAIYYEKVEDWTRYANLTGDLAAIADKADPSTINTLMNELCWNIFLKVEDPTLLSNAITAMGPFVEKTPDYNSTDTYASLLYKTARYNEALDWAGEAIKLAQATGEDSAETEKLISKIQEAMKGRD